MLGIPHLDGHVTPATIGGAELKAVLTVEYSHIESVSRLTKTVSVDEAGRIKKVAGTQLYEGTAKRRSLSGTPSDILKQFDADLAPLGPNECVICAPPPAGRDEWQIRTADKLNETPGAIARSKDNFRPVSGPAVLMLDIDAADFPEETYAKIKAAGKFSDVLASVFAPFGSAARLARRSTSSGIKFKSAKTAPPPTGQHLYFIVDDGESIKNGVEILAQRLVLAGFGWIKIGASGSILQRTMFDEFASKDVGRLVYEADAVIESELLEYEKDARKAFVMPGGILPLSRIEPLTDDEQRRYEKIITDQKRAAKPAAAKVREEYRKGRVQELEARGMSPEAADRAVAGAVERRELSPEWTIHLDGGRGVTVREILDDPTAFHRKTCGDPLEPEYNGGRNIAIIYADSQPIRIFSHAHGGIDYRLVAPAPDFLQDLGPDRRERPIIEVIAGEMDTIVTAAEDALIASKFKLFERGQKLVELSLKGVEIVTSERLIDLLSRIAIFQKRDRNGKQYPVDPPRLVADILRSRHGAGFLPLAGVISTPTLRPDGSVLDKPGYDEKTRLYLLDPPQMPAIPERPSKDDALAALELLEGLLVEFPFKTDADKAVALSALITPVVRGALSVAPMHAIRAPVAGSGKSYLVDLACLIATGGNASVVSVTSIAEMDKTLTGCLTDGHPIIPIDNVSIELDSDLLNQAISQPVVSLRRLQKSDVYRVENRTCIFATGNNLQIANDSTRRVVACDLDPNTEQPEHRIFTSEPDAAIRADRGKYIAAALTIVRAYVAAGHPNVMKPLGSFGDWSRMVRSALVWLGCVDPVLTQQAVREGDPTRGGLVRVLSAWEKHVGLGVFLLAGELCGKMKENADFRDAVSAVVGDDRGHFESRQLAGWLTRSKDRHADGLKIVCGGYDRHEKQNRWGVVAVAGSSTRKDQLPAELPARSADFGLGLFE